MTDKLAEALQEARSRGWMVAIHNDYRLNGNLYTFWLFTTPDGRAVKGEGRTDEEAIAVALASSPTAGEIAALSLPAPGKGEEVEKLIAQLLDVCVPPSWSLRHGATALITALQGERDFLAISAAKCAAERDAARAAEREECAKLADAEGEGCDGDYEMACKRCAVAIRARSAYGPNDSSLCP